MNRFTLRVGSIVLTVAAFAVAHGQPVRPPVVGDLPTAMAESYAGRSVYIKSRDTQQYLDVKGGNSAPGTPLRLYSFNATKAQVFTFEDAGNDYYRIRTNTGGWYLTLEQSQARAFNGAAGGGAGGGPTYELKQKALAVTHLSDHLKPWPASGSQLWRVIRSPDASSRLLVNKNAGTHALQSRFGTDSVGYAVRTGMPNQQWILNHAALREHPLSDQADRGIPTNCYYQFRAYWFINQTLPRDFFRVLPEWRSVGEVAPPAGAGFRPRPALETLEGTVTRAGVSTEDAPISHYTHDFTFHVAPDPMYRFLLADKGSKGIQQTIEVEWEAGIGQGDRQGVNPCAGLNRSGESCGFYSAGHTLRTEIWNWPGPNDWVHVEGEWIWDRGHPPASTEIHPPRFVAIQRDLPDKYARGDSVYYYATRADLFASGDGGALRNNRQMFQYVERVPMKDKNYTVTLRQTLPRPAGSPALKVAIVDRPAHSFPTSAEFPQGYKVEIFSDGTADIPQPHVNVTIPWFTIGAPNTAVFARTMFLYWDDAPTHGVETAFDIRTVGVTLKQLEILTNLEGNDTDPGEARFFANAGGRWLFLNEFTSASDILSDGLGEIHAPAPLLGLFRRFDFTQTIEVYVPRGKEVPFGVSGWEDDYIGGHFGELLNPHSSCDEAKAFMDRHFDGGDAHRQGREDDNLGTARSAESYANLLGDREIILTPPSDEPSFRATFQFIRRR